MWLELLYFIGNRNTKNLRLYQNVVTIFSTKTNYDLVDDEQLLPYMFTLYMVELSVNNACLLCNYLELW